MAIITLIAEVDHPGDLDALGRVLPQQFRPAASRFDLGHDGRRRAGPGGVTDRPQHYPALAARMPIAAELPKPSFNSSAPASTAIAGDCCRRPDRAVGSIAVELDGRVQPVGWRPEPVFLAGHPESPQPLPRVRPARPPGRRRRPIPAPAEARPPDGRCCPPAAARPGRPAAPPRPWPFRAVQPRHRLRRSPGGRPRRERPWAAPARRIRARYQAGSGCVARTHRSAARPAS